ncbi:hypothetical protein [Limnochorda pilosa]|uniref:HEPN domain-containing protein n=1 Tax=Limnochorda pilosa TaxID=1555112 RepID=A0A0K2SQU4_LIMPI|nr:hypothetical protein [Limnochorda pilosa]BAS29377.1 hypothetical protein LIP_3566 [Limnochorda pilosa]
MSKEGFSLPSDTDRFFVGEDRSRNAVIRRQPFKMHTYIEAYKDAADTLVASTRGDWSRMDLLVFPIAYCYRQHFELQLKAALKAARRVLGPRRPTEPTHNLAALWRSLRSIIEELDAGDRKDLDTVTRLIGELNEVDPNSEAFRYPTSKSGAPWFPDSRVIDLENLRAVADKLSCFLWAV